MWKLVCGLTVALIAGATASRAQTERFFTIDDLFRLEELGDATLSPDGTWVAYVVRRPRSTASHFKRDYLNGNDRGDVWLAPAKGGASRNLTGGSDSGWGYWAPRWSPDGQRLAMLSTRDNRVRLWLWSRDDQTPRLLTEDAAVLNPGVVASCVWMNPTSLVVSVMPAGTDPSGWTVETRGPETAMREWPRSWKGELTASVLESGTAVDFERRDAGRLLLVNVAGGRPKEILRGLFRELQISPDRRHVAFLRQIDVVRPVPGTILFSHLNNERLQIGIASATGEAVLATAPDVREVLPGSHTWSPDGRSLAFLAYPVTGSSLRAYRYRIDTRTLDVLPTGELELVAPTEAGGRRSVLRWSGRGDLLLYTTSAPGVSSTRRWEWWLLRERASALNVTAGMKTVPPALFTVKNSSALVGLAAGELVRIDVADATSRTIATKSGLTAVVWPRATEPADTVIVRAGRGATAELYTVDLRTDEFLLLPLPAAGASLVDFAGTGAAAIFSAGDRTGSYLWSTPSRAAAPALIRHANAFLQGVAEGQARRIDYVGLDGTKLVGWVLLPPGHRDGERHALVTWVYGDSTFGDTPPASFRLNNTQTFNLQLLAAQGYAVLVPSMPLPPEGVASDIYLDLAKGVLPAVDKAIDAGLADPDRLGLIGHSFGGHNVYVLVTQTQRFKAAVALAGPSNLASLYGQFDPRSRYEGYAHELMFEHSMAESGQFRLANPPWLDAARYLRNSPLFYADRVQTPLLIVQGDQDYVPITQGEEFFTALYRQNKRATFVRYWGEGHIVQGAANMKDMWQRIYGWFDQFIGLRKP